MAVDDEKFSNGIEEKKDILLFLLFKEENNNVLLEVLGVEDVTFVFGSRLCTIATVLKGEEDAMTGISSSSFCNFKV